MIATVAATIAIRTVLQVNSWSPTGQSTEVGVFCVFTGICDIALDLYSGDYYAAGYGTGHLEGDIIVAAASEGIGEGVAAGLRGAEAAAEAGADGASAASRAAGRVAGTVCVNSFAGTTLVLMADGTTKAIDHVIPGDEVTATDPTAGSTSSHEVTVQHINYDTDLADLTIQTADGKLSVLHTTQNHPFWDATTGQWIPAAELEPGHTLATPNGSGASVVNVRDFIAPESMYNPTVADIHTYYVVAGDTPVLVHNDSGDSTVGTIFRSGGYTFQMYSGDHGPGHGHLKGNGYDIQLGQNGKPLDPNVTLNKEQQRIVDDNIQAIRKSVSARMAAFKANGC